MDIKFIAQTPIWTGDANGKADRLITTGLLGSIRWWFEVLVRGLDGSACDPTNTKCEGRDHCVVCELFGCTGWARKFRLDVLDEDGNIQRAQIKEGSFQFRFTPLRPIRDEEWALLEATLQLIANYGAIGGKTSLLPTNKKRSSYVDYGIIQSIDNESFQNQTNLDQVKMYTCTKKWRNNINQEKFAWASLEAFWVVEDKQLNRKNVSDINRSLTKNYKHEDGIKQWLLGKPGESKKIFSFKNPARTFGFVKPGSINLDEMKQRLESAWGKNGWEFLPGDDKDDSKDTVMKRLFVGKDVSS
jgi:CRISPR-associated protein Cmr1